MSISDTKVLKESDGTDPEESSDCVTSSWSQKWHLLCFQQYSDTSTVQDVCSYSDVFLTFTQIGRLKLSPRTDGIG